MNNLLPKAKKFAVYALAIIGVVAILWLIFGSSLTVLRQVSTRGGDNYAVNDSLYAPGESAMYREGSAGKSGSYIPPQTGNQPAEGQLTKRKVIKNGELSLLVKKAEEAAQSISAIGEKVGGFIQNSNIYEVSDGIKSGTISIRVPADRFGEAMSEIKKLAVKVESEQVTAQDVTEQFTDYETRLKVLRAQEVQYLDILKRSGTIPEVLSVTQNLNSVRSNIESIQGQLQYLTKQVDMSVITTSLTSEADVEVFGIIWRPLFVAKQAFRNMLSDLSGYIDSLIRFLFSLPVIILWVVTILLILYVVWKIIIWLKRKFFPASPPHL